MTDSVLLQFLQGIIQDVEIVDGGCSSCVGNLVDGLNEQLRLLDVPYHYEHDLLESSVTLEKGLPIEVEDD